MMEIMCVVLGNIIVKSVYTICVTVAAIYFARPAILWWYVLLLLNGSDGRRMTMGKGRANKMKQNTEKSLTCCDCIHDSMCHLTHTKDYPICCEFVHKNQHGAWIKVEEQTPPNREDILVWAFFRDRWNVFVGWYSDVSGIWRIATECGSVREVEVSHWMPLPMDPSEVES